MLLLIKTKVLLPEAKVVAADFGYPVIGYFIVP